MKMWNFLFKFGVAKTKCMAIGKNPLPLEPKWYLGD
jgi:hypothetical protein